MLAAALNLAFFFFYFQKPQEKLSTGGNYLYSAYVFNTLNVHEGS